MVLKSLELTSKLLKVFKLKKITNKSHVKPTEISSFNHSLGLLVTLNIAIFN